MAFRKAKNHKKPGSADKNGGKNVRSVKQKNQMSLVKKPKQQKQELTRKVKQIKTDAVPTPAQRRDYAAKATQPVDYKKHRPFDDQVIMGRIKALTGSKSTGKAKASMSVWPQNTTS